jgi:hypothetical protein
LFTQYWYWILKGSVFHFTPTEARTIFVTDVMDTVPQQFWPGIASAMGNSVRQWLRSYTPLEKQKQINGGLKALRRARLPKTRKKKQQKQQQKKKTTKRKTVSHAPALESSPLKVTKLRGRTYSRPPLLANLIGP